MQVVITLRPDELTHAIEDFLPMRLLLGRLEGSDDPTWVQIDAIGAATFVPRRGLRVSCRARVHYPLPIVPDDFFVDHAVLEMTPAIVSSGQRDVLAFQLRIAAFDPTHLPDFVDTAVAERINSALHENTASIAWDFSRSLSHIVPLPGRNQAPRTLELDARQSLLAVSEDGISLSVAIDLSFHHEEPPTWQDDESTPDATWAGGPR